MGDIDTTLTPLGAQYGATLGKYIDPYTMRESIEDKVTLEIVYEGRTHNAEDSDPKGMGVAFADVFSNYNLQERLALLGFGSRDAYLQAQPIIAAKAKDMVALNWSISSPMVSRRQVVVTSDEPF